MFREKRQPRFGDGKEKTAVIRQMPEGVRRAVLRAIQRHDVILVLTVVSRNERAAIFRQYIIMAHIAEQIEVGKRIVGNIQMHLPEAFRQKRPVLQVNGFDNIHKISY